jgi:hypothetical protein
MTQLVIKTASCRHSYQRPTLTLGPLVTPPTPKSKTFSPLPRQLPQYCQLRFHRTRPHLFPRHLLNRKKPINPSSTGPLLPAQQASLRHLLALPYYHHPLPPQQPRSSPSSTPRPPLSPLHQQLSPNLSLNPNRAQDLPRPPHPPRPQPTQTPKPGRFTAKPSPSLSSPNSTPASSNPSSPNGSVSCPPSPPLPPLLAQALSKRCSSQREWSSEVSSGRAS